MITEKQVRERLRTKFIEPFATLSVDGAVEVFRELGVLAEPQDKPLLGETVMGEFPGNHRLRQLVDEHQAALDAFAMAVLAHEELKYWSTDQNGGTSETRPLKAALAAARKAGLTKVGA